MLNPANVGVFERTTRGEKGENQLKNYIECVGFGNIETGLKAQNIVVENGWVPVQ